MDFAALPPEINSGLMYTGPGSAPMMTAAASWQNLAAEVSSAASDYGAVISGLTTGPWQGPASASMVAAAAPYLAWMSTTAAQAEQAATQAKAAAGAYETAFALTVPPPVIAANRALLASLVASNFLGQNTPAIAATEAHYAEMWAQDGAAMYGYAGSSAAASTLTPFTQPPPVTTAAGPSGVSSQATLSQLTSSVPAALQSLASPSGNASLQNFWSQWGPNANIWNTIFSSGFYMPSNTLGAFTSLFGGAAAGEAAAGEATMGAAAAEGVGGAVTAPLSMGGAGSAVSATVGRAAAIGSLSVPPSWTAVAPVASPVAPLLGSAPISTPPAVAAGVPGMPFANAAASHLNGVAPRYGFRPTVMAHPPAAG